MSRNKYGIIDFGKLIFTSIHSFGDLSTEDIGNDLTEKQKQILDELSKGNFSKLIYIDVEITDRNDEKLLYRGLASVMSSSIIQIIGINSNDQSSAIQIYEDTGSYYLII